MTVNSMSAADISKLDAEGYFTSTPAANILLAFPGTTSAPSAFTNVPYKLVWPAGTQFTMRLNMTVSNCTGATNVTVSGCSGGSATFTTAGSAGGSVTFQFTDAQPNITFLNSGTYSHTLGTEIAMYRVSDEVAYQAGRYFTPEAISLVSALRPRTCRFMGWVQKAPASFSSEVQWRYRVSPTSLMWGNGEGTVPPGAWGGTISGTDTYTIAASTDFPSSPTDGATIVGLLTNTNTSTTPTLQAGSWPAKTIVKINAATMTAGNMVAGQLATFVYDELLDKFIYAGALSGAGGGIFGSVPVEAQVQFANLVGCHPWVVVPQWADDDYVTNLAQKVLAGLRSDLLSYFEWGNEIWNNGYNVTNWATLRGTALGFPASFATRPMYSYYALRSRQIMGNVTAVFGGTSRLRRSLMFQGAAPVSQIQTYRLAGADLAPSGTSTGTGNSLYCTYTGGTWNGSACSGGADYTQVGNRPVDYAESIGYAPYVTGNNICFGPDSYTGCAVNSNMLPFYQALVNAVEAGDTATANALVDDDLRQGRQLVQNLDTANTSGTTFATPTAHGFTANSTNVIFSVTGGTSYSGLVPGMLYQVSSTPTTSTFTIKAYSQGSPAGSNVNAGTQGSGTVSVGSAPFSSMLWVTNQIAAKWEPVAAAFDPTRGSLAPLRVEHYEANLESVGPSAAQCATIGVTGVSNAQCAADVATAIENWKNSALANATQVAFFKWFMGTDAAMQATFGIMTHSQTPSQFVLGCSSIYAIVSGCGLAQSPYQTYYGFQAYSAN